MKIITLTALVILPSLACVIGAVMMALNDKSGWGWMLFVALLISGSASVKEKKTNTDDTP